MNTTKRYARTLVEAFGPYEDTKVYPMRDERLERRAQAAACLLIILALGAMVGLAIAWMI